MHTKSLLLDEKGDVIEESTALTLAARSGGTSFSDEEIINAIMNSMGGNHERPLMEIPQGDCGATFEIPEGADVVILMPDTHTGNAREVAATFEKVKAYLASRDPEEFERRFRAAISDDDYIVRFT